MIYIETFERDKSNQVKIKKIYRQELKEIEAKKGKIRKEINEQVFDIEDSLADNAKMIFLLTSLLMRIYNALPDDIKGNLSDEDRQIVEYAFNKYTETTTRLDLQFQEEGIGIIDKLLNRQKEVANVIEEVNNG